MRLLPILLLCSYCLLGSATLIDVECNNQNVFRAVDEALRFFNNEKEDGNQFILYRITDAKIKNEEDGQINYFVKYETHEGSCEVNNGKSWQECSSTYKNPGKCSAHVLFTNDENFKSVEYQNCTNSNDIEWPPMTTIHQPCLGCPQPIDKENKELLCFVHSAIEQVNADAFNHSFYFDLESIENAMRQVRYGWQYHIRFLIRQTNCSKSSFASKHSRECILDQEGESIVCNAQVFVTSKGEVEEPFVECKSGTGVCINCPIVVTFDDPELQTLLLQVMDEYNFNSNHTHLYNVVFVERAVKKGFQRELYEVTFAIDSTNCSKSDYSILGSECHFDHSSPRLSCRTKINVTDKTINVHSAPDCKTISRQIILRYGGLSPLRFSRNSNHNENDSMSKLCKPVKRPERPRQRRHGHENNKTHKNEKKGKKNKKKINKSTNQPASSSEEDNTDEVTQSPLQQTNPGIQEPGNMPTVQQSHEVSTIQEISPNKNETSVLEFTSDVAPRCPGRVWQPISLTASNPTVRTSSNDDLAKT